MRGFPENFFPVKTGEQTGRKRLSLAGTMKERSDFEKW